MGYSSEDLGEIFEGGYSSERKNRSRRTNRLRELSPLVRAAQKVFVKHELPPSTLKSNLWGYSSEDLRIFEQGLLFRTKKAFMEHDFAP